MILERPNLRLTARLGFVLMGLGAAGCWGDSPIDNLPRQPIAGLVLVDGRPLRKGSILFFPAHHPVWGATVSGGSMIDDGRFSIPWDKGLVPGNYRIAISAEGKHKRQAEPSTEPVKPAFMNDDMIPERFNIETELEVEVKEGGVKQMKIEIDSK